MTSMNTEETLILKTDVLGRVRMPAQRREAILDAFEQSGMSGQAFARHVGVKYPTFASWIQKRRRLCSEYTKKKQSKSPASPITFVEARIEQPCQTALQNGLEVQIEAGIKMVIRSQEEVELAAGLIRSLSKSRSC